MSVGKTHLHGLGAVGDRAAADGDDEVGLRGPCRLARLDHGGPRRVRRHAIEAAGAAVAERAPHLADLIRIAIEGAAHHQEDPPRPETLGLRGDRLGRRFAEHHLVHLAENHASRWQHALLPADIRGLSPPRHTIVTRWSHRQGMENGGTGTLWSPSGG
jgi:hypothetical protein